MTTVAKFTGKPLFIVKTTKNPGKPDTATFYSVTGINLMTGNFVGVPTNEGEGAQAMEFDLSPPSVDNGWTCDAVLCTSGADAWSYVKQNGFRPATAGRAA